MGDIDVAQLLKEAAERHQQNEVQAAETLYRRILALVPGHPDALTKLGGLCAETKRESEAENLLDAALHSDPTNVRAHAQRDRLRFLKERAEDPAAAAEVQAMHSILRRMNQELARKALYVPSAFWGPFAALHVYLLERYGVENFKRTVAHNYHNWLMVDRNDHQVQRLLDLWSTHLSSQPLRNAAELPSDVGFHHTKACPFYPLSDPARFEVYKLSVGLLWEYGLWKDDSAILDGASESQIGNPLRIYRDGKLISSDLCHSVRERNQILELCGLRGNERALVAELGAGNGRLAEVFGRTTNYRYWIFDIAPTLYVSQWYVKKLFPGEKVFEFRPFADYAEIEKELAAARFAFFTANQIELLPPGAVDIFVNINSLTEMAQAQIDNFLLQIDRVTRAWFFLQQWYRWENQLDNIVVTKDTFRPRGNWDLTYDEANEVYPDFFVQLWKKPGVS